jgi:hypothetical protein
MIVNRRGLLDLADFDSFRVLAGTRKFREIVLIPMILDENGTGRGFLRILTAAEAQAIAVRVGQVASSRPSA